MILISLSADELSKLEAAIDNTLSELPNDIRYHRTRGTLATFYQKLVESEPKYDAGI